MVTLFLLLGGCTKYASLTPAFQLPDHRYVVEVNGQFTNIDPEQVEQGEDSFSLSLRWDVHLAVNEQLRDDSAWMRLSIEKANYRLDDTQIEDSAEGKVLDVRIFPWGELLSVRHMDYLSGEGRWLDVFEPILPTLFPNLPNLRKGERVQQEQRWPVVEGETTIARAANRVEWTRLPNEGKSIVLSYEGKWLPEERGTLQLNEGTVRGQVWINSEDSWLERHQWQWARSITDESRGHRQQVQAFEGEIWRIMN